MQPMRMPAEILRRYEIVERHHAAAILAVDFPEEWKDILAALRHIKLPKSQILKPGDVNHQSARASMVSSRDMDGENALLVSVCSLMVGKP
jgi:hypothetical protein